MHTLLISNAYKNDHFFISHYHDALGEFAYLEEGGDWLSDQPSCMSRSADKLRNPVSIGHPRIDKQVWIFLGSVFIFVAFFFLGGTLAAAKCTFQLLGRYGQAAETVNMTAEVSRYIQDTVVFLRLHRAVAGGISTKATVDLFHFSR